MGLDTYASRTPEDLMLTAEDEAAFAAAGVDLCGGVCSDGVTSIRGKVYNDLVMEVSGISLYQEWTSPEEVRLISAALDARTPEALVRVWDEVDLRYGPGHAASEAADLQLFFRVCAERGLGLIGWW
jgi:hypothetical protein